MIDINDAADRKELARTIAGGIAMALTLVVVTITFLSL